MWFEFLTKFHQVLWIAQSNFDSEVQSNPDTAPLYIRPPSHCAHESLVSEIPYVISKGISSIQRLVTFGYTGFSDNSMEYSIEKKILYTNFRVNK
jgi:hypothetical protein